MTEFESRKAARELIAIVRGKAGKTELRVYWSSELQRWVTIPGADEPADEIPGPEAA